MGVFRKGRSEISCPPKLRNNHGEGSGKELSNASTFRNNHPQRNSAKPAGSCVSNTQRTFTFLARPCSRNHIEKRDCFKKTATSCKTKKHCFRNKPIVFSLRLSSGHDHLLSTARSMAAQKMCQAKVQDSKLPNLNQWSIYIVPHTHTNRLLGETIVSLCLS